MIFKLNFSNTDMVSAGMIRDDISIKIIVNEMFRSEA